MKTFLSIVAILMLLLGAGWLFAPKAMLASWGVASDTVGVYLGQRYGGLLLGYAAILWRCRTAGPSSARSAVLSGGAAAASLLTLLSLWGVLAGTIGPGAWAAVVIEALLAGGFCYYALAEPKAAAH
jgi:hypothetical protein